MASPEDVDIGELAEEESEEHDTNTHANASSPMSVTSGNGELNKSFAIRRQTLTDIFLLPLRVVYAFPRPLRDAITKLRQPFQDGILDLYSQQVCELLEAYEANQHEKQERERRVERRSRLRRGPSDERESDENADDEHEDEDWQPCEDNTDVSTPVEQPEAPQSSSAKHSRSEFSTVDTELPPPPSNGRNVDDRHVAALVQTRSRSKKRRRMCLTHARCEQTQWPPSAAS